MNESIVLIPARRASSRLPGKPLAKISGEAMIVHVWRRALRADCGHVVVATDDDEIADAITSIGGHAVMTKAGHSSGSDRIYEALQRVDPENRIKFVVNLQGDLPTIEPELIRRVIFTLTDGDADIATLAAVIDNPSELASEHVVKIATTLGDIGSSARALYFSRTPIPFGSGTHFHHIGLYAYRRNALARFVSLPPSVLEQREQLEQLRALEAGMTIDVTLVDTVPLGVDTPEDLARARHKLARQ
jgi:3-deoxy-manno-octulosonate cytidylyltransferase (CMP-KDO synthetase)